MIWVDGARIPHAIHPDHEKAYSQCYGASWPGLVSASAARAAAVVAAVLRSSEKTPPE